MKRRILHVAPFLWSGAGSVITRLCVDQARDHDVAIVTSGRSKGMVDWPVYRRRLEACGIPRFMVDLFDRDASVFWSSVESLDRLIRERRPDIVHAHAGVPAAAAAIVRQTAERPFALVAHLYSWGIGRPEWMTQMDLRGFAAADRVVCSSDAYRDILLNGGIARSRISYVPWGLPLEELRAHAGRRRAVAAGARIGFVGRVEPRKGQLALVEAFSHLRAAMPRCRLELVGPIADAAYGREVERAIRVLRLGGSVRLLGLVRDVPPRLAKWDLFVSLSSDEGQGLAVLEAMAVGVPVVARRVAGIEDYLQPGTTGIELTTTDPRQVAAVLSQALTSPVKLREMAGRASRMVGRRYAWDATVRRIEQAYGQAAA